jgi:hypothetical protein
MKQKQVNEKKQNIQQKPYQFSVKSKVSARVSEYPFLQSLLQGIIGNHGMLRHPSKFVQPKLIISQPDDYYEIEANRVAEQVMRMENPEATERVKADVPRIRLLTGENKTLRPSVGLEARINAIRGSGKPLTKSLRDFFESRFGYDFGNVRFHTDSRSDELNRVLGARAFTAGADLFFRKNECRPESKQSQKLTAHELTHVVQQGAATIQGKRARLQDDRRMHTGGVGSAYIRADHGTLKPESRQGNRTWGGVVQRDVPPPGPEMITRPIQQPPSASVRPLYCTMTDPCFDPLGTPPDFFSRGVAYIERVFILGPEDDPFLSEMRAYIQDTLGVPAREVTTVGGIDAIYRDLVTLEPAGFKVVRLVIVSHGTGGTQAAGGGGGGQVMGAGGGWITPQQVMQSARTHPLAETVRRRVMAPGATVEFWGCNIGSDVAAMAAWSTLFGARFRATRETMRTDWYRFGEYTSSAQIASAAAPIQQNFRRELLELYSSIWRNLGNGTT